MPAFPLPPPTLKPAWVKSVPILPSHPGLPHMLQKPAGRALQNQGGLSAQRGTTGSQTSVPECETLTSQLPQDSVGGWGWPESPQRPGLQLAHPSTQPAPGRVAAARGELCPWNGTWEDGLGLHAGCSGEKAPTTAERGDPSQASFPKHRLLCSSQGDPGLLLPSRCPFFQPRWLVTVGQRPRIQRLPAPGGGPGSPGSGASGADPPQPEWRSGLSESRHSFFLSLTGVLGTSVLVGEQAHGGTLPERSPAATCGTTHVTAHVAQRAHVAASTSWAPLPAYLAVPRFRYWHSSRCLKVFLKVALQSA